MKLYKHYSFDLWLTLIKSNPQYKIERTKLIHDCYNPQKKTLGEVATIFRQVDLMINGINERAGKNIDAEEMYLMVISMMNGYSPNFGTIDVKLLYEEMEDLVFDYMPEVYCRDTADVLARLKESGSSTVSLLSNTGFIKGRTLRKVLKSLKLDQYLDFQLYSDEERLSKPNRAFFQLMLDKIDRNKHGEIGLHDVVHIGDNFDADFLGAQNMGIHSIMINSNEQTINCLR